MGRGVPRNASNLGRFVGLGAGFDIGTAGPMMGAFVERSGPGGVGKVDELKFIRLALLESAALLNEQVKNVTAWPVV